MGGGGGGARAGGGGGGHFRSGSSFSQMIKLSRSGASAFLAARQILHFLPFWRPPYSTFLYIQAIHCHPRPAYCSQPKRKAFGQRPGVTRSGRPECQPECQPDTSYKVSSGDPHFHAQARTGAPHFSLSHGTYLPKYGMSAAPPPPPSGSGGMDELIILTEQNELQILAGKSQKGTSLKLGLTLEC